MSETFNVRRDSSTNNVPVVGYNDGVDAQDVLLFGVVKVTEQLVTDGAGMITLSNYPVSISGATFKDVNGVRRARNLNDDITIMTAGGVTYYAGSISPTEKTLKVYTNAIRTIVATGSIVNVTYYKRVPVKVNANGELVIEGRSTQDVNVTNLSLPVTIKSSDIPLSGREKVGIMFKKEGTIAAGASANEVTLTIGDGTKDMFITNIIAYYNGTGEDTDPYVPFWFDQLDAEGVSTGWADMFLPPYVKGMMQLNFGEVGVKIPANGKFRFRVGSTWTSNKIHVCAYGWQYVE